MREEQRLVAGDSLSFTTSVDDYPASDGWTLKYRLVPRFATPVQVPITLIATTYETHGYQVQAAPATTALWKPGVYAWSTWVEKADQRQTLEITGEITVLADPAQAVQGADVRSDSEKALAAVDALLSGKATSGVESYEIETPGGRRKLTSYPLPDLIKLQQRLRAEVDRERIASGLTPLYGSTGPRRILVRL